MSLRTQLTGRLPVPATRLSSRVLVQETVLVLLLSLGASAIYSILSILRMLSARAPLRSQTSTLHASQAQQSWLDLTYQVVGIGLGIVPVLLVIHLLARELRSPLGYLGLDRSRLVPDSILAAILAACIGLPGLALYAGARAAGLNTTVVAGGLNDHWWTLPVLVLSAVQNALLEEVIMVGYLFTRWSQAGWRAWQVLVVSALIRGSYHLYQGFGGFVGNFIMGLILGCVYLRTRRVLPLVITHAILDIVAFVGYTLLHNHLTWL